jgi:TPP-dependent pyruvate/acetoin dehydrogenase alpha subunit
VEKPMREVTCVEAISEALVEEMQRDPVARFREEFMAEGVLTADEYRRIELLVQDEIYASVHYGEKQCSDPDPHGLTRGLYADG